MKLNKSSLVLKKIINFNLEFDFEGSTCSLVPLLFGMQKKISWMDFLASILPALYLSELNKKTKVDLHPKRGQIT